ncbi:hypothetical protein CDL15_Pgr012499 [Punica granatum]|uniref:Uncharacterized protein n=1 Tax=Punica granatum TaxID=22663 RepID=A0A218WRK9_PUNGR|nr:hypothetical protein CDL15_Pgr012499 [Punica granatum]
MENRARLEIRTRLAPVGSDIAMEAPDGMFEQGQRLLTPNSPMEPKWDADSAQYGTLKILLGAKVTNDMSGRASEASCSSRDTPDLSQTPLLTGLPGPDPLTSKRHPETGLQAPRDHRGHGTSFR